MSDFKQITPRRWRHPETDVTVSKDDDKRTWTIRTIDGFCLLYSPAGNPRRFRSLASAIKHGQVIAADIQQETAPI